MISNPSIGNSTWTEKKFKDLVTNLLKATVKSTMKAEIFKVVDSLGKRYLFN